MVYIGVRSDLSRRLAIFGQPKFRTSRLETLDRSLEGCSEMAEPVNPAAGSQDVLEQVQPNVSKS